MSKGFKIRIQAPMALFSRPELKSERYSYDIPTPSALRGVLESIYWHPGITYVIDEIKVINPIKRISVRRNELKSKLSTNTVREVAGNPKKALSVNRKDDIAQRNSSILTNVDYLVSFHFEVNQKKVNPGDSEEKFAAILGRRLDKGQCYKQPYLGCREFAASVKRASEDIPSYYETEEERDFGLMLYDLDYSDSVNPIPVFYHPIMRHGIVTINKNEVYR